VISSLSDPPRPVIRRALETAFRAYNPGADIQEVDFDTYIDENLSIPENIAIFEAAYPQFRWRASEEEQENPAEERLREDIEALRQTGLSDTQIRNILSRLGINMVRIQRGLTRREAQEINNRLTQLEREISELRAQRQAPPPPTPEQQLVTRLNNYIQARAVQENISPDEMLLLSTLIDTTKTYEENVRRIEAQIEAIKATRQKPQPQAPAAPQPTTLAQILGIRVEQPQWIYIPEKRTAYGKKYVSTWRETFIAKVWFRASSLEEAQKLVRQVEPQPGTGTIAGYQYDKETGDWIVGEFYTRKYITDEED
jgi:hypothetical protein